jgi:hypothetical protein
MGKVRNDDSSRSNARAPSKTFIEESLKNPGNMRHICSELSSGIYCRVKCLSPDVS